MKVTTAKRARMTDEEREAARVIQLSLTRRQAEIAMSSFRAAIRKAQANKRRDPGFVPEPGHFDANESRILTLESLHEQLQRKYREAHGQE